jgi:hypothetical protein
LAHGLNYILALANESIMSSALDPEESCARLLSEVALQPLRQELVVFADDVGGGDILPRRDRRAYDIVGVGGEADEMGSPVLGIHGAEVVVEEGSRLDEGEVGCLFRGRRCC